MPNMEHAPAVVEMLRPLVESDHSIVGVLGFDESRKETVQAIDELNSLGLPMIAPTLSADGLDQNSDLYFQMVPANLREATMMAEYLEGRKVGSAKILYSVTGSLDDDLYVRTLRDDLAGGREAGVLAAHGVAVDTVADWEEGDQTATLDAVCSYDGAVLYVGRAEDFELFLHDLGQDCSDRGRSLLIIGDDSVSRFMASRQARLNAPSWPLVYASKAALTSCDLSSADARAHPTWSKFVEEVGADPWDACKSDGSGLGPMGERVALAYDATDAYLRAVRGLDTDRIPLSPPAVWESLGALQAFDGISGLVDFRDGRVQDEHWIALMAVDHVNDAPGDPGDPARVVFHCGWANSEAMQHSSSGCSA
jgi:hypothetical protein